MSEEPHLPGDEQSSIRTGESKRSFRILAAVFALGITLWQVWKTEVSVADLRARGFTDVVISSTRDHAYFPLVGGILGAAIFIRIHLVIRRAWRRDRN